MSTRDLIDAIESGNSSAIQQHFQDAIMSRVAERLDTMRIETAKSMFKSSVNEAVINTSDYHATSEKSQFGGFRPLVKHKDTGDTMYLSQHSYKTPDDAKDHADEYLKAYAHLGPIHADRAANSFVNANKHKLFTAVNESADFIHQVLADNDINSKVMGNTVHVDHDDVEKAQELIKYHGYDHQVQGGLNETWRSVASDFGYDVEQVPNYMKYNHEVGQDVFTVHHTPEGSDYSKEIGRVNSLDQAKELVQRHATKHEPDLRLNEVLSKDATAGEWIADFVKSDDPKFKGKTKKERIKMALGAHYGAQRNESVELDEEAKIVHTRKGANGYTYNVKQNASNEYEIHSVDPKGKSSHIDTYQSLHRAKSVLDNEVKESVELDETSCGTKKKWGAIKNSMGGSTKK